MRLINADALIEILTTAIRNMKGVAKFIGAEDDPELKMEIKAYTDILNGVKEQPTIEPEPHWIPCSERLPEENKEVLISADSELYIAVHETINGNEYWSEVMEYRYIENVVAWMPLPEPYEGDDHA